MQIFNSGLASFTSTDQVSIRIPAGSQLEPGEAVYLTDNEAGAVEAYVLSVADNTALVHVLWDRSPVPVFDLELSPAERQTGMTYLHDVYLDTDDHVATGDRVLIRDEGGHIWVADVGRREDVRLGHKFALRLYQPSDLP